MTPLEKLAWAAEQAHNGPPHSLNIDYIAIARAVISSIEPDDAMVEVAMKALWPDCADENNLKDALKTGLRSLLEGETGR